LEWVRLDASLSAEQRDQAVDEFIQLVVAVDGILQAQAAADARYFASACGREVAPSELALVESGLLQAYRWQYIFSGAEHPHFLKVLTSLVNDAQLARLVAALRRLSATPRPQSPF
jgi:hypothetical protein